MSPELKPGDPVRLTRSSCKGQKARIVNHPEAYPGSVYVAIDKASKGAMLPRLAWYTDQNRAPRKLVPLSYLESIPETT